MMIKSDEAFNKVEDVIVIYRSQSQVSFHLSVELPQTN